MARSAILNVMVQAAMKAGRSLARDFGEVQNLQVSLKGPGDYVSQADKKAEDIIYKELSRARPDYSFLMEESGEIEGKDSQHRWLVDPLDGTTNFLHGIPVFGVSIALERQGVLVAGVPGKVVRSLTEQEKKLVVNLAGVDGVPGKIEGAALKSKDTLVVISDDDFGFVQKAYPLDAPAEDSGVRTQLVEVKLQ